MKNAELGTLGAPSVPGRVVEAIHALPQVLSQQAGKGSSSAPAAQLWRLELPEESKASPSLGATVTCQQQEHKYIIVCMVKVSTATLEKAEPSPSPAM